MWTWVRAVPVTILLIWLSLNPLQADAPRQMEVMARVGPWPVISQMIGYRGRVWFANSVKGVNHNSADLYSLDPRTGDVRYERHLMSQDAGDPLVHNGLLYWPYEDTRSSLGWGGVEVTNGESWRYFVVPSAEMFHIHALAEWRGGLLAVSSAWRAGLQLSRDGGREWEQLYDHTTAPGKVSRMGSLVTAGGQAVAHLRGAGGVVRLVRWTGEGVPVNVKGWQQRQRFHGLTAHGDEAYLVQNTKAGSRIWVVDGSTARELEPALPDWRVWDLASDGGRLWAVTRIEDGGQVWSSPDGEGWRLEAGLRGGQPMSIAAADGAIYVGGTGDDGKGVLWGLMPGALHAKPVTSVPMLPEAQVPALPEPQRQDGPVDHVALAHDLDEVLADPENYFDHGRGGLRGAVYRIARSDPPADLLSSRLGVNLPGSQVPLMGGSKTVARDRLGQWIVLWGMAISAKGKVPLDYLSQPWDVPRHGSEKYFHPLLMALWTIAQTGQNDAETVAALIGRLDRKGDPPWLKGDVVGALSAVTGERFAYDTEAWRRWWAQRHN